MWRMWKGLLGEARKYSRAVRRAERAGWRRRGHYMYVYSLPHITRNETMLCLHILAYEIKGYTM